jgi:hypothetical protein
MNSLEALRDLTFPWLAPAGAAVLVLVLIALVGRTLLAWLPAGEPRTYSDGRAAESLLGFGSTAASVAASLSASWLAAFPK